MENFYPCTFIMNDYEESDGILLYISYYRFLSKKSKIYYIVRIEVYKDHVYGVKFFTKQMLNSVKKYSHLTNTYEPRTILYSVFKLMLDIYAKDKQASFMFIGNADENGNHENTRRYRLYCNIISNIISDKYFKHLRSSKYSLYILANRLKMSDSPFFGEQLLEQFIQRFIQDEPEHPNLQFD